MRRRTSHSLAPPRLHVDERRPVEAHKQTEHKLDLLRRYYGRYLSILGRANSEHRINGAHVYVIDMFAGVGRHLSVNDPLHEVPGSAKYACIEAQRTQRRFPGTRVHVRLVDSDDLACRGLLTQITEFTKPAMYPDKVDVTVTPGDFADHVQTFLSETESAGKRYCSLWLFDPFDLKLPRASLSPLLTSTKALEIIVNLDVGAIHREIMAVIGPTSKATAKMTKDCEDCLNALFGNESWKTATTRASNYQGELDSIARMYAASFADVFRFSRPYALRSSDGQHRYFIHMTNHEKGETGFASDYRDSLKIGLAQGKALSWTDRSRKAMTLMQAFGGKPMSLAELRSQTVVPLTKQQSTVVANHANDTGYARYDQQAQIIYWNEECAKKPDLALLNEISTEPGSQTTFLT